jgi:hypothetical protein
MPGPGGSADVQFAWSGEPPRGQQAIDLVQQYGIASFSRQGEAYLWPKVGFLGTHTASK